MYIRHVDVRKKFFSIVQMLQGFVTCKMLAGFLRSSGNVGGVCVCACGCTCVRVCEREREIVCRRGRACVHAHVRVRAIF